MNSIITYDDSLYNGDNMLTLVIQRHDKIVLEYAITLEPRLIFC